MYKRFPVKNISIQRFRKGKRLLHKQTYDYSTSFSLYELFSKRVDKIRRLNVSIKVKAVLDNLNGDKRVLEKGPFQVKMPWKVGTEDKYKYAVKVLFDNNFPTQSAEVLEKIGFSYAVLKRKYVEKHNMQGVKLESYFINRSNGNKTVKKRGENCVIYYVWPQVKDKSEFKTYTFGKLHDEILRFVDDPKGGKSTFELVNWVRFHSNVSVHAFDARYKTFITYSTPHTNIVLCYVVKDHHLQSILDKDLKQAAVEANKGGSKIILKNLVELKWSSRSENIIKVDDINEIIDLHCYDTLIVLPKIVRVKTQ